MPSNIIIADIESKRHIFCCKNEIHLFTPKISIIIADMAEAATFTVTYLPSTSKRPCGFCLVSNKDFNNMALTHVDLQTPEKMKEAIDINQAKELSVHTDFNFFGILMILTFMRRPFQIECTCLISAS